MDRIKITDWVMNQLNKEELHENDKLPPEEKLAKVFGVSTTTVRKEITLLREKGIIFTVPGSGNFISPFWSKNLILEYDIENLIDFDSKEVYNLNASFLPTIKRIRKIDNSFLFLPNAVKPILVKYFKGEVLIGFMIDWHLAGEIKIKNLDDLEKVNAKIRAKKGICFNKKINEISWKEVPNELRNIFLDDTPQSMFIEEWLVKPNRNIYSYRNAYIKPEYLKTFSFSIK